MLEHLTWAAAMKHGGAIAAAIAAFTAIIFAKTIRKAFPKFAALPFPVIALFLVGGLFVAIDMASSAGGALFGFYHVPAPLLVVLAVVAAASALVATFTDRLFVRLICLVTAVTTSALAMLTSVTLNEAIMGDGAVTAPASVEASMNWRKDAVTEARLALADARGAVKGHQLDAASARDRIDALTAEIDTDAAGTELFKEIESLETVLTEGKFGFLNAKQIADIQIRAGMEGRAVDGKWGEDTRIALGKHIEDKRALYAKRNDTLTASLREAEEARKTANAAQSEALARVEHLQTRYDAAVIAAEGTQESATLYAGAAHAAEARNFVMRWATFSTTDGDASMNAWWHVCLYFSILLTAMGQSTLRQAFRILRQAEPVANDNIAEKAPRRFRGVWGAIRIATGYWRAGELGAEAVRRAIDEEQTPQENRKDEAPTPTQEQQAPVKRPPFFDRPRPDFELPAAASSGPSPTMADELSRVAALRSQPLQGRSFRSFPEAGAAIRAVQHDAEPDETPSNSPAPKRRRRAGRRGG